MSNRRFCKDIYYELQFEGLLENAVFSLIDNKYLILQDHPDNTLLLLFEKGKKRDSFEEALFFIDCLSFEHDLPGFLIHPKQIPYNPLYKHQNNKKFLNNCYVDSMLSGFHAIKDLKLGPMEYVVFRWKYKDGKGLNLPYTQKYGNVKKEISLYSHALKQLDPLAEFLFFYRVIECLDGGNGNKFINNNLNRIDKYDFGFLELGINAGVERQKRRINLFSRYRKRAMLRIKELNKRSLDIPKHLYKTNRCGIAHGRSDLLFYDFTKNLSFKKISIL